MPQQVNVEVVEKTAKFNAGQVNLALSATSPSGEPIQPNVDGRFIVQTGSAFDIEANGFQPGAPVEIWLYSDPVLLASVSADADGRAVHAIEIGESVPAGDHHVVFSGLSTSGDKVVVSAPITVRSVDTGIAHRVGGVLVWVLLFVALLFGLVIPTRIRRRSGPRH